MQRIGPYQIEETVAGGWLGTICRATDPERGSVRLQLFSGPGEGAEAQARLEALRRVERSLHAHPHPNVIALLGSGSCPNDSATGLYLASEWFDGVPLKALIGAPLSQERAHELMAQILMALGHVHKLGLVLGDLNPDNIWVGAGDTVCLTAEALLPPEVLALGVESDSPAWPVYLAPERLSGEGAGTRTDLYAAGVICRQLLGASTPFRGATAAVMRQMLTLEPPLISAACPTLGTAYDSVIATACARDPQHRFGAAMDFLKALNQVASQALPAAVTAAAWSPEAPASTPASPGVAASAQAAFAPAAPGVIESLEAALSREIGPMGHVLVRRYAANSDVGALPRELAALIPSEAARARFLRAARQSIRPMDDATSIEVRPPNASVAAPARDVAMEGLRRELFDVLGPIAAVLIERADGGTGSQLEFAERVLRMIPLEELKARLRARLANLREA